MILDETALEQREVFCLDLTRSAAALALLGFERQAGQPIGMKGLQDCLTQTNGAVERHIRDRIQAAFPDDGFPGEETGGTPGQTAWVVDPIDGTANFARSIPRFRISIAFVANGEVRLGVISNPVLDELYFARKGRGAWRNGTRIRVSATTDIQATAFELGWSNRVPQSRYLSTQVSLLDAGSNVRRGASGALGLAYVADGRSDGYAELHMNSWDCLAGLPLVREAGGVTGAFLSIGGLILGALVLAASPASGIPLLPGSDLLAEHSTADI